jgi:tyrosyl-tRNA synthetase
MTYKSELVNILTQRGFLQQATHLEELDERAQKPLTAYIGFDCTGDSLHVGGLVMIMMLRWLEKTGHKPLALLGGATTQIGDPTGKSEDRKLLSSAEIEEKKQGIIKSLSLFLSIGNKTNLVDNADWLSKLEVIPFLRDIGRHFSVNRMLSFDSVKQRLDREQPFSFLEFNYMVFQAYDFYHLAKEQDCVLQMGGSDQWGNIVNGVDLTRRLSQKDVFGWTAPLITTSDGKKMGKTAQGAVWLNEDKLPSYDYWQFWRNTHDQDVGRFLRLFTELPLDEIERLEQLEGAELNEAKMILAHEATALCRGKEAAEQAATNAKATFSGGMGMDMPSINGASTLIEALCELGFAKSKGEARRLITGGGAKVNDVSVQDVDHAFGPEDFGDEAFVKISAGKKRHGKVIKS